jgi:hypothetical protein
MMAGMTETTSEHSQLGIASFVVSFVPGVLLLIIALMVEYAISKQPPDADTVAYGFWSIILAVWVALTEIVALGLGIAGALQRQRRKLFAFLGVACSVLVLAVIHSQVGLGHLASLIVAVFTEPQRKVHSV